MLKRLIYFFLIGIVGLAVLTALGTYAVTVQANKFHDIDMVTQTTESPMKKCMVYSIRACDGYLAVYEEDELYEITDIRISKLDNNLKKDICKGIVFESQEDLRDFLDELTKRS
jgi:hypothetical protein